MVAQQRAQQGPQGVRQRLPQGAAQEAAAAACRCLRSIGSACLSSWLPSGWWVGGLLRACSSLRDHPRFGGKPLRLTSTASCTTGAVRDWCSEGAGTPALAPLPMPAPLPAPLPAPMPAVLHCTALPARTLLSSLPCLPAGTPWLRRACWAGCWRCPRCGAGVTMMSLPTFWRHAESSEERGEGWQRTQRVGGRQCS